jgi:serine/threonine protein kinase
LDKLINENKKLNKKFDDLTIFFYSQQILKGLDFLHENKIIHRDLKPKYKLTILI